MCRKYLSLVKNCIFFIVQYAEFLYDLTKSLSSRHRINTKKWKFEYKLFDDFIIWKTDIEQNKNFQIGVVSPELWFIQSWPMMPSFVCITISGLMIVASMKTHKLKLPYILNTKADFQKLFLYYRYIPTLFENAS